MKNKIYNDILNGNTSLGIELGSTRIKAVLLSSEYSSIAHSNFEWKNKFENGVWTYDLCDVWTGIRSCFSDLRKSILDEYGIELKKIGCIGISAMMHGYLAFDENDELLVPFRTWRNTMTECASRELSALFGLHIPQRYSIAHLYEAMLKKEEHLPKLRKLNTLAGYVHYMLSGEYVLGVGDASGMFPIDPVTKDYDSRMLGLFDKKLFEYGLHIKTRDILPKSKVAGEAAGFLTQRGVELLDETLTLEAGIPLCPPEGDAGTGMVATNSIAERTGNISAGTSIFAMIVLERPLAELHEEIDIVSTPAGKNVAMVHCNNCTSDINAWAQMISDFCYKLGVSISTGDVIGKIFSIAADGDPNCGGLLAYNYLSGEHITSLSEGRPMFIRTPNAEFTAENFSRTLLYSAVATLKLGMNTLTEKENVKIDRLLGHGGFFKTPIIGQQILANALKTPISVMEQADEGGAYGMALLASFLLDNENELEAFLSSKIFGGAAVQSVYPEDIGTKGFEEYIKNYERALDTQRSATENIF